MSLGFAMVQVDVTVVNVAVRPIGHSLGASLASLQWIVGSYTLVFAALILTAGALGDRLGSRRVFLGGLALASASSTSYLALLAPLVCLGAGLGLVVPPMTALLLGSVERARSGIAAGTLTAMRQTGSVLGVAGFGSLLARGIVGGLHASLVVSTGLLGAAALSALPLLPRRAP